MVLLQGFILSFFLLLSLLLLISLTLSPIPQVIYQYHSKTLISFITCTNQEQRRKLLQEMCSNDSVVFPGKNRSFDDIPNKELDHLIVDDRHGIIYCYVPKVRSVLVSDGLAHARTKKTAADMFVFLPRVSAGFYLTACV